MIFKTPMKYHFIPSWMAVIKKIITSVDKDVEKREPLYTIGRDIK